MPVLFSLSAVIFHFSFLSSLIYSILSFGTAHLTLAGILNALAGTKLLRDYCPAHPGLTLTIRNSICILKVKFVVVTATIIDTVE